MEPLNAQLDQLIALMPGHVYWKDINGKYLGCNELQAKSAGYSRKEIIGKTDYDMPWKNNAEQLRKNDHEVITTGISKIIEEISKVSDGREITFLSNKVPLQNDKGEIIGILGISFDITDRKLYETQLKESETKTKIALTNILDHIPAHIYWKDRNCVLIGCNELQAKNMGFKSASEMIGKTNYEVIWQDQPEEEKKAQAEAITNIDLEVMESGNTYTTEEPLVLPDGSEAIYLSRKSPLKDDTGKIVGLLGISFDITEQKRLEKELQETLHKLDGMTVVAASIAHELRTPLATLSASIHNLREVFPDLLEGYRLAKEAGLPVKPLRQNYLDLMQDTLKSMEKETRAAFTFIEMLLMNVKPALDEGEERIFSIHKIITETIDRYPFSFNQKNLMQWKDQETNDFQIKGKAILITHILFNLIKNALYYIEKAGKGEITISLKPGDKFNTLYVKDTGTGMPPEVVSHVFDRFFSRTPHGAGIGLTYCKMAMETFNGNITCQSVDGEYTLFTLTFPAKFKDV